MGYELGPAFWAVPDRAFTAQADALVPVVSLLRLLFLLPQIDRLGVHRVHRREWFGAKVALETLMARPQCLCIGEAWWCWLW